MTYSVPKFLRNFGDPVPEDSLPSVLLRFPGACGVRNFLYGRLFSIARPGEPLAYFTRVNFDFIRQGVSFFGCLIVFEPRRFSLVKTEEANVFIGMNKPVEKDKDVTWIPPRLMDTVDSWEAYDSVEKVHDLIGGTLYKEREQMLSVLNAYFEEVSMVVESKLPLPKVPWYEVPAEERLNILAGLGQKVRWSLGYESS